MPTAAPIASLFFESGPAAVKRAVGQSLARMVENGDLRVADIEYASWLLPNMAFGKFQVQLQFGLIDGVPEDELEAHLGRVVDDFLRLFGS